MYLLWLELAKEGWELGPAAAPPGWRVQPHKAGPDCKFLTPEMIVFLNSADAFKYIRGQPSYSQQERLRFRRWMEESGLIAREKENPQQKSKEVEVEKHSASDDVSSNEEQVKTAPNKFLTHENKLSATTLEEEMKSEFVKKFAVKSRRLAGRKPRAKVAGRPERERSPDL